MEDRKIGGPEKAGPSPQIWSSTFRSSIFSQIRSLQFVIVFVFIRFAFIVENEARCNEVRKSSCSCRTV